MTMMNGQIQLEHQYLMIFGKILHCIGKLIPEFDFLAVKYRPFVYNYLTIDYSLYGYIYAAFKERSNEPSDQELTQNNHTLQHTLLYRLK